MTDYTDALCGLTQDELDRCDVDFATLRGGVRGFLNVGCMHGASVTVDEGGSSGLLPALVRDGVVLSFLIPPGTRIETLADGLAEGGTLADLIDTLLAGHRLTVGPDRTVGRLTEAAAIARDSLLDVVGTLAAPATCAAAPAPFAAAATALAGGFLLN